MLPNKLSFVGSQAIQVAIIRAKIDSIVVNDRTAPDAILLFRMLIQAALEPMRPDQFAILPAITTNDAIFRRSINETIGYGGSRV